MKTYYIVSSSADAMDITNGVWFTTPEKAKAWRDSGADWSFEEEKIYVLTVGEYDGSAQP